jgi:glycosyltransferase involved in cell wall biosynthesis
MTDLNNLLSAFHGKRICAPRLWVDVTALLGWHGAFTGIPRTVSSILAVWLDQTRIDFQPCIYDPDSGTFVEVPRWLLAHTLSASHEQARLAQQPKQPPPTLTSPLRAMLRSVFRFVPEELREACGEIGSGIRRAGHYLAHCKPPRRRHRVQPPPAALKPGDIFLAPCGGWDHAGFCAALAALRSTHGIHIAAVVYDVIPCLEPQLFPPQLPSLFTRWLDDLLPLCDLVLTISENSRMDISEVASSRGLPLPPVEVIRLGVEVGGRGSSIRPASLSPDWDDRPFVLSVGTVEVRKNHVLLYHVWRRLIDQHGDRVPPLILAGSPGWLVGDLLAQLQHDPLVREHVLHLPGLSNDQLHWLYQRCLFTLYPSRYEGWGLPVAEALACGKYCISSIAASLPEIAGDMIDYHDPLNLPDCLHLTERALFEEGFLHRREERILREYQPPSWRDCAASLLALLLCRWSSPSRSPQTAELPSPWPVLEGKRLA